MLCGDNDLPYNNVLKEDMQMGKDYQLISKEQWLLLEQNYAVPNQVPVYTIKRFHEKLGMGIRTFPDLHYQKVRKVPSNLKYLIVFSINPIST